MPLENLIMDLAKPEEIRPEIDAHRFPMDFETLHPKIVHRCHFPFETGDFEDAIFSAMTVVEEEVRAKISADSLETGVALIFKAMDHQSPLL